VRDHVDHANSIFTSCGLLFGVQSDNSTLDVRCWVFDVQEGKEVHMNPLSC
jgi:hypothetical protein